MLQATERADAVVVGGGPAGLAAAIAARLQGLDVVLSDAFVPPIDKACGEGLMPDGVAALRALGVAPERFEHAIFRGIRFVGRHGSVDAHFPSGHGIGLRRTLLHEALRQRAAELGVRMFWGTRAHRVASGAVFLDSGIVEARWIVGADGQNSRIRAWSGLARGRLRSARVGLRRHFRVTRWTDLVEVHWGERGQAYVTPVADDEVCIAVLTRHRAGFDEIVDECPALARHLRDAQPLDALRGSSTTTRTLRSVITEGVALVGEASGSVDAVTGEGMTLSFRQAVSLATSLASNDPGTYAAAHRRIGRLPNLLGSAMLLMDHSPVFRKRALAALIAKPAIFQRLLAIHLGENSPLDLGIVGAAKIGWQLLFARG